MKSKSVIIVIAVLAVSLCLAAVSSALTLKRGSSNKNNVLLPQTTPASIDDKADLSSKGYTVFGKWMINTSKTPNYPANWLQRKYADPADGNKKKTIVEPINIVVVDSVSKTADAGIKNFDKETLDAGYWRWALHSAGYKAWLKDDFHWQIFNGNGAIEATCYQTKNPLETNNHGRVFGPVQVGNAWIFTAAFSREKAFAHDYISFKRAAKDFAKQMDENTSYKNIGVVSLDNVIIRADQFTGDHDGNAIVLKRK